MIIKLYIYQHQYHILQVLLNMLLLIIRDMMVKNGWLIAVVILQTTIIVTIFLLEMNIQQVLQNLIIGLQITQLKCIM